MPATPGKSRLAAARWFAGGAIGAAIAITSPLRAQTDSATRTTRFSVAAGPALTVGVLRSAASLGYLAQASVVRVRPTSPWRLRGDVVYQHVGDAGQHMRKPSDRDPRARDAAASSALGLVNVALATRHSRSFTTYLLVGAGGGWTDEMRMSDRVVRGGGAMRLAWQGGAGLEWVRRGRVVSLESRLQTTRSTLAPRWYTTVPLLLGVSF